MNSLLNTLVLVRKYQGYVRWSRSWQPVSQEFIKEIEDNSDNPLAISTQVASWTQAARDHGDYLVTVPSTGRIGSTKCTFSSLLFSSLLFSSLLFSSLLFSSLLFSSLLFCSLLLSYLICLLISSLLFSSLLSFSALLFSASPCSGGA